MPEITLTLFALLAVMLVLGFVLGWILRGGRIAREKTAIHTSWQEQMSAQKTEHDRLADQNKSLMEQISEYRASKKDSDLRAKELSSSLKEAFEKRDELQRQLKDVRSELDVNVAQRNKLRADLERSGVKADANSTALKGKDDKIFKLGRELESWKNRLPPLIERFRLRDLEAQEIEVELEKAQARLADLENAGARNETRIEPIDSSPIADGLDASNDQYDETSAHAVAELDEIASRLADEEDDDPAGDEAEGDEGSPEDFADDDAADRTDEVLANDEFEDKNDGADEAEFSAGSDDDSLESGNEDLAAGHDEPAGEIAEDDDEGDSIIAEAALDNEAAHDTPDDEDETGTRSGQFDAAAPDDPDDVDEEAEYAGGDSAEVGTGDATDRVDALQNPDDEAGDNDEVEPDAQYAADATSDFDGDDAVPDDHSDVDPDDGRDDAGFDDRDDSGTAMFADGPDDDINDEIEDSGAHGDASGDELRQQAGAIEDSVNDARDESDAAADEDRPAPRPGNGASEPAASRDDLQQIKGVGPAIEKTLNGLGFYRFRQIAEMSEYDIDRVARELRGFRSRIYREDWMGQARMLQVGKSGTYTT